MAAIRWGNQACEDGGELRGCNCRTECVCVCVRFSSAFSSFFLSLRRPVRLNIRSCDSASSASNQVPNKDAAGLHHYHFATKKKKKKLLIRPQLERKHSGISGNGHNRTIKGDYRKTDGKRALGGKKSTRARFLSFLYFIISTHLLKKTNPSRNQ